MKYSQPTSVITCKKRLKCNFNLIEVLHSDGMPVSVAHSMRQSCHCSSDIGAKREGEAYCTIHYLECNKVMFLIVTAIVK